MGSFRIWFPETPMDLGWDRYQEILDQFSNLKVIQLAGLRTEEKFMTDVLPKLSEINQEIWKERLSYFQARGIRIIQNFVEFENFRKELEKEAGITWSFQFGN